MAMEGRLFAAVIAVVAASCFDFLDGFSARLLHAYSVTGKELDSLSDEVSFGVAPGMIIFYLLSQICPSLPFGTLNAFIPYFAFVIPILSGLRLAKFNIDTRQTESFLGLPVPAHALFWASLAYSLQPLIPIYSGVVLAVALIVSIFLTSLLLVSEIPMFSMKVKSAGWKGNELRYILGACGIGFIAFGGILGIAATIFLYVLLSIFNNK
ncbi:CDP-diacylglycerol--serine O-phosphatidyltransferase [Bacteroidia bacterium]|nr:CDP-diacylglycerol--serine O-phosphatidyltransferase [Bacteroidia bacterium]GHU82385.1 CDP-diacylglycerol--serine O-phosphatidyltransferase [Bacteroidia bacterium]GHV06479.1 CDP-diacylglycerol--serine O-phosphatidyltransferase [Bacteroidia bacterium]